MVKNGRPRPANSAAHHIVAFGARKAAVARAILNKYGINLNSAENGVFLPKAAHSRLHTKAYYEAVDELLSQAASKEEVIEVLKYIRSGLENGTFP